MRGFEPEASLVCVGSNAAPDNVALRLVDNGLEPVRVGNAYDVGGADGRLKSYSLLVLQLGGSRGAYLQKHNVVCSAAVGAGLGAMTNSSFPFFARW